MAEHHGQAGLANADTGAGIGLPVHARLRKAFESLPGTWRSVLWYADVMQDPPELIGPLIGVNTSDVPALLERARDGLREAYEDGVHGERLVPWSTVAVVTRPDTPGRRYGGQ